MLIVLVRMLVLLAVLTLGVPLAMEAADAVAAEVGVPAEKVWKVAAVAFGLFLLANWRPGNGGRRGGGSRRR